MTTITVDARREQMMQRLEAGRAGEFLTMADPYLEAVPEDHYVRLMAIREYLKLGLVLPARELLEAPAGPVETCVGQVETRVGQVSNLSSHRQDAGATHGRNAGAGLPAEFDAVRQSMAGLKSDEIPWSKDAERFDDNLDALSRRGIDVAPIRDSWIARRESFQRFRDRHGVTQVRMRHRFETGATHGGWQWIPRLGDHPGLEGAPPLPEGLTGSFAEPFLFEGLDLGWYFRRVYEATQDTFLGYSCALFVVEPDPALLALVLHLHDWRDLLLDRRVFWFVGDGWAERLRRAWEDVDLPWPQQGFRFSTFRQGGRRAALPSPDAIGVVQEAASARENAMTASSRDVEARYASRDLAYWARRFAQALSGEGPPLRILAGVSTHTTFLQYSMRDAQRAFESLGHRCTVLTEKTPYTLIGPLTYHNAIRELDPDLFFNIDHLRPEFGNIIPSHLPALTWDQDQLPQVFTKANMERISPLDFVAGWSKLRAVMAGCNPKQFLYASVPTCPEQFSGDPLTEAEYKRYACDVSYVSHASQTPQAFHEEERARFAEPQLQALLDVLYEITPSRMARHAVMGGGLPAEILDEASRRCGLEIKDEELRTRLTGWYLWRLGDRIFRHEALEWVAAWARRSGRTLRIYGNGWDKHPTLSEFAAGPVANGRELFCVYRASKINLQLMPAGFAHQRALDGLASGGFFLSRQTPSDLRGRILRRLNVRMDEVGIDGTRSLMESTDAELQTLMEAYGGEWLHRVDRDSDELYYNLRILVEDIHPDEVFENFAEILFDSSSRFAELADAFHADDARRRAVSEQMRRVVIEHYSYRSAMDRFLHAMAAYLKEASGC